MTMPAFFIPSTHEPERIRTFPIGGGSIIISVDDDDNSGEQTFNFVLLKTCYEPLENMKMIKNKHVPWRNPHV